MSLEGRVPTGVSRPFSAVVIEAEVASMTRRERRITEIEFLLKFGDRSARMMPVAESSRRQYHKFQN